VWHWLGGVGARSLDLFRSFADCANLLEQADRVCADARLFRFAADASCHSVAEPRPATAFRHRTS
jgi:hypothetical protein